MSESGPVRLERRGNVAVVVLDRPEAMNAINEAMRKAIPVAIDNANADGEVRAIVITGAGDRAFSAGADIKEFRPAASLVEARKSRRPPGWNDIIAASPKPTIAAIRGVCLGGGLEIALSCDLRIAASDAVLGLPETRLAIIPGAGGTQRLPRLVGLSEALRLVLTGERIGAEEAWRIGLVTEVVAADHVLDRALDVAGRIAEGGPIALRYAKEAVRRGVEMSLPDGLSLEADLATLLTNTEDRLEAAAAFREKRMPVFKGQ